MRRALYLSSLGLALVVLAVASFGRPVAAGGEERTPRDYQRDIFLAVLAGLYTDGVQNDVVDLVTVEDPVSGHPMHFIYACPICMPAFDAFRVYRARPEFYGQKVRVDTFGNGLPEPVRARLLSDDITERLPAIESLVEGWIERWLEAQTLTESERAEWTQRMAEFRKKGMALLDSYRAGAKAGSYAAMKGCAFCDAANGACARPE